MAFDIIVTENGRAALINAANTGTAPVTIAEVGLSATAIVASPATAALPGEIKRIAGVSGLVVADDTIHINVTDASADAYSARSLALYLADGTLFASYGQVAPFLSKTAETIGLLSIDVIFADIAAAQLTFGDAEFVNPPATTEQLGVVELLTLPEAQVGNDPARVLTAPVARAALMTWLLAQDGSGSGLDADTLDGQQGAWYSNIPARLGYTPLNQASYTAADVLAKLLGVDGSGSGLDADTLDGQQGAWYSNIPARLGFTPLDSALYTAVDVLAKLLGVDGSGSGLDADLLDGQHGAYYTNIIARLGYTPLNQASYSAADVLAKVLSLDGSGSGLDADLWRGKTPAQFLADYFQTGSNANGRWWKTPDGAGGTVIEQQGLIGALNGQVSAVIYFPIPFTDLDYDLGLTAVIPGAGDYDNLAQEIAGTRTLNSVTVYSQDPSSGGSSALAGIRWRAKGY